MVRTCLWFSPTPATPPESLVHLPSKNLLRLSSLCHALLDLEVLEERVLSPPLHSDMSQTHPLLERRYDDAAEDEKDYEDYEDYEDNSKNIVPTKRRRAGICTTIIIVIIALAAFLHPKHSTNVPYRGCGHPRISALSPVSSKVCEISRVVSTQTVYVPG